MSSLTPIASEFVEQVTVAQATCFDQCLSVIASMLEELASNRAALTANKTADGQSVDLTLQEKAGVVGFINKHTTILNSNKDLARSAYHVAVSKLSKALDKVRAERCRNRVNSFA
jgi:hypothetical protein